MAKVIKVPDDVYEKAKKIANEKKIPIWKAVGEVYIEFTGKPTGIPNEVNQKFTGIPEGILKELTEGIREILRLTRGIHDRLTSSIPEYTYGYTNSDDLFDYLVAIIEDLYEKYGKKEFTEEDFERIKEQILQDKGVSIKTKDIIDMLVSEGIIKKVKKKYELVVK